MNLHQENALRRAITGAHVDQEDRDTLLELLIELKSPTHAVGEFRVSAGVKQSIDKALDEGNRILAIKELRNAHPGATLRDAKAAIDAYHPH